LGQSYGDLGDLEPIGWDAVRDELDAQMVAKGYVKDGVRGYRKVSPTDDTLALGDQRIIEFKAREDGLYRITSAQLIASGIDLSNVPKGDIAVIDSAGEAIVRYVWARGSGSGSTKTLGSNGALYFYAVAPRGAASLYSDSSVYRLVLDRQRALGAQVQGKQGINSGFSPSYTHTSVVSIF